MGKPANPRLYADPDLRRRLASILRKARQDAGLTLRKLSARAGLSNPFLSNVETGQIGISVEAFVAYCRGLGLDPCGVLASALASREEVAGA